MPLQPPKLDDRDFQSLFEEARTRIPRYVPEWTDWNESDPGITLLQLQTWLTETILFRLNQLPDLNYIKFLQLLGVEQRPAQPAQAELTFTLKESTEVPQVLIEKGTVIGVSARDLEEPLFFETDRTLRAISARLTLLVQAVGGVVTDVTQANDFDGRTFTPFGEPAQTGAALLLGFSSPLPFPRQEIGLQIYLAEKGQALLAPPQVATCGPAVEDDETPQLAWEWWDGTGWDDLDVTGDETHNLTQSGQIYFKVPGQIPAVPYTSLGYPPFQEEEDEPPRFYWLRIHFEGGSYAQVPEIDRVLTNTVRATAALTVFDEAVGSSDGTPNQTMTLRHSPVLAEPPLQLEVDEGSGPQAWEEVTDFFGSKPDDAHYLLNRATGQITFGDGQRGRIPVAGQFNVVARQYRYGGGRIGNVGTGTITDLATAIRDVDEVTNHRPAIGGQDEESLDETKLRGPRDVLKTRDRAVTLADFALLAQETPGALVARAHAYPEPAHQGDGSGGSPAVDGGYVINVVIVPQSEEAKPVPSEAARQLVCRYLDERRLITTQVHVLGPPYHDIDLVLDVRALDDADLKAVKNAIADRLADYFHPLRGGVDGEGWPFGRDVYYSELLREIMLLPGIQRVNDLKLLKLLPRSDGSDQPYFDTADEAASQAATLLQAEIDAFCAEDDECQPESQVLEVVQLGETEEDPPQTRYYVAAVYDCCDLPVADGALVALHDLEISVNYSRGRRTQ